MNNGTTTNRRFAFGANWQNFLSVLNEERIAEATRSLQAMMELEHLAGKSFIDVGCGSGLFSLAARRLGGRVHSFDYDADSVSCAQDLKNNHFPDDEDWTIEHGSVLDKSFIKELRAFDVVYSWGVLHHTGDMWNAIESVCGLVKPGGVLFLSIYNDQGRWSVRWRQVKRWYNALPRLARTPYVALVALPFELRALIAFSVRLRPDLYLRRWTHYKESRGMSRWHDWVDWVGGYPYEVARPEDVIHFLYARHFVLTRLKTVGGNLGCNEFVFRKAD